MKEMKGKKGITRRSFMKGAAVAGGAFAGVAMLDGMARSQTPARSSAGKWDREAGLP